jgi:hypothetical protein
MPYSRRNAAASCFARCGPAAPDGRRRPPVAPFAARRSPPVERPTETMSETMPDSLPEAMPDNETRSQSSDDLFERVRAPRASGDVPRTRTCMSCGDPFPSQGWHNRLCGRCRKRDAEYG